MIISYAQDFSKLFETQVGAQYFTLWIPDHDGIDCKSNKERIELIKTATFISVCCRRNRYDEIFLGQFTSIKDATDAIQRFCLGEIESIKQDLKTVEFK